MKRFDSINVIPFIDIMLVLLAIVLTTATFIGQGRLDIELPEAQSQDAATALPGAEIAIDADAALFYNREPVTLEQLRERLADLRSATPVTFRVDRSVAFDRFVAVIDLLKARDLQSLSIVTRAAP